MAAANERILNRGNFNEVPTLAAIQKISSQKNLKDRQTDKNQFIDLLLIQKRQLPCCKTQKNLQRFR